MYLLKYKRQNTQVVVQVEANGYIILDNGMIEKEW